MDNNSKWWNNPNNFSDGSKTSNNPLKSVKRLLPTIIVFLLIIITVFTSVYTVNDKQQAVITTFGKVTNVTNPGIHVKLPFGIQKAQKVDVNVLRKIELGYRTDAISNDYEAIQSESKMISGDYNIVNCDFFVEYKISDPVKYLYNSQEPDLILKSLAQSHIRNVISSYNVDSILTTGKGEIQALIKEGISNELAEYNLGLILTDIKLQDSEPPTQEVIEAFKGVETAKQEMETAINVAEAYKNAELPKAEADADKLIKDAEYSKQNRINEANMQIAMFNAMYEQYTLNPSVTKKRMFFEMTEKVLPGAKIYIDASDGSVQKLLPVESFSESAK